MNSIDELSHLSKNLGHETACNKVTSRLIAEAEKTDDLTRKKIIIEMIDIVQEVRKEATS